MIRHQYNFIRVDELRAMLLEIQSAETNAQLSALYVRHIGYDVFEDDPGADFDDIQSCLEDFIREVAHTEGIHWDEVTKTENR